MNYEEFIKYCDQIIKKYSKKNELLEKWVVFHSRDWGELVSQGWVTKLNSGKLALMTMG